jgi:hypothetical protein
MAWNQNATLATRKSQQENGDANSQIVDATSLSK